MNVYGVQVTVMTETLVLVEADNEDAAYDLVEMLDTTDLENLVDGAGADRAGYDEAVVLALSRGYDRQDVTLGLLVSSLDALDAGEEPTFAVDQVEQEGGHANGCPLSRPWLYDPDERPLECLCRDLAADRDQVEQEGGPVVEPS